MMRNVTGTFLPSPSLVFAAFQQGDVSGEPHDDQEYLVSGSVIPLPG